MGADRLSQLCTWFDSAYGLHPDLKSHTGGCMSFGYEMINCKYINQKLNKNISTEAKLISVSDYLPYNIFICLFMVAQVYDIKKKQISGVIIVQ